MTGTHIDIRPGVPADAATIIALLDESMRWLVSQGRTGQWGTKLASQSPARVDKAREWAAGDNLYMATHQGVPVGALVVGEALPYAPPADEPELYVVFLVADRSRPGLGVGAALLDRAHQLARQAGVGLQRVDCYAGDDRALVGFYERHGFTATDKFSVKRPDGSDWPGQILERRVS